MKKNNSLKNPSYFAASLTVHRRGFFVLFFCKCGRRDTFPDTIASSKNTCTQPINKQTLNKVTNKIKVQVICPSSKASIVLTDVGDLRGFKPREFNKPDKQCVLFYIARDPKVNLAKKIY